MEGVTADPIHAHVADTFVHEVQLRHFRAFKEGKVTLYSLQLADGQGRLWTIVRRYSEFLQCHVQLLELFERSELPPFPPKDLAFRKVFRRDEMGPNTFLEQRKVLLYQYICGLLDNISTAWEPALLRFLEVQRPWPTLAEVGAQWSDRARAASGVAGPADSGLDAAGGGCSVGAAAAEAAEGAGGGQAAGVTAESPECLDRAAEDVGESLDSLGGEAAEEGATRGLSVSTDASFREYLRRDSRDEAACALADAPDPDVQEAGPAPEAGCQSAERSAPSSPPSSSGTSPARPSRVARAFASTPTSAASTPGGVVPVPKKRLLQGDEVHQVMTYSGSAAAAYARKVEENQKLAQERAPLRFEKTVDGSARSVPVKFSMVHGEGGEAPRGEARRSLEDVDKGREEQRMQRFQEEEQVVARWIHAVTGDPFADASANGDCSLQRALQSGEALCDLVNAIWPGSIVGIKRDTNDTRSPRSSRLQLANLTMFVQACRDLGVDDANMFTPPDLFDGKSLRRVVRCIFALGALAPGPPDFDGPRIAPSALTRAVEARRGCEASVPPSAAASAAASRDTSPRSTSRWNSQDTPRGSQVTPRGTLRQQPAAAEAGAMSPVGDAAEVGAAGVADGGPGAESCSGAGGAGTEAR